MDQQQSHGNSVLVSQRPYNGQDEWGVLSSGFSNESTCLDPADDSDSQAEQPSSGQVMLNNNQQQVVKKRRKQPDNFGKPQISFHFEKEDCELRKSKAEPTSNHSSADEADLNENSSNPYGYEDPDAAAAASRLQNLTLGRSIGSRQIPVTKVDAAPTTNPNAQTLPALGSLQETEETGYLSKTSSTDSNSLPSLPRRQHSHRSVANKSRPLQDRGSSNQNPDGHEDPDAQPARDIQNPYGYGDPDAQPVQESNPYGYGDPEPQPARDSNNLYGYGDSEPRDNNPYGYGDPEPQPARPSRGRRQYSRRGSVTKFSIQASIEVVQKCNTAVETTYKTMTSQNGSEEPFFPFSSQRVSKTNNTMESPNCKSVQALQGLMMKTSSQRSISNSRRSESIGALRINPSLPNTESEVFNPSWRSSPHFSTAARSNSLRSVLNKALSETGSIQVDLPAESAPSPVSQDPASSSPAYPITKTDSLRSLYHPGRRSTERDSVDDGNLHVLLDESLDASLSNALS